MIGQAKWTRQEKPYSFDLNDWRWRWHSEFALDSWFIDPLPRQQKQTCLELELLLGTQQYFTKHLCFYEMLKHIW